MTPLLRSAFDAEMSAARTSFATGDLATSFSRLERAHILGQRALWPHIVTHWWMLKVGVRRSDRREIRGQIARIIAAVVGYVSGWVPLGNTGGANVSPLRPMPVPPEFALHFEGYDAKRQQRRRLITLLLLGLALTACLFASNVSARAGENLKVATRIKGSCVTPADNAPHRSCLLSGRRN